MPGPPLLPPTHISSHCVWSAPSDLLSMIQRLILHIAKSLRQRFNAQKFCEIGGFRRDRCQAMDRIAFFLAKSRQKSLPKSQNSVWKGVVIVNTSVWSLESANRDCFHSRPRVFLPDLRLQTNAHVRVAVISCWPHFQLQPTPFVVSLFESVIWNSKLIVFCHFFWTANTIFCHFDFHGRRLVF